LLSASRTTHLACTAQSAVQLDVGLTVVVCWLPLVALQLPTQGAVTTLIAAPQGVLRNFYPMKGEGGTRIVATVIIVNQLACCTSPAADLGGSSLLLQLYTLPTHRRVFCSTVLDPPSAH
jgi:hypothetical protein